MRLRISARHLRNLELCSRPGGTTFQGDIPINCFIISQCHVSWRKHPVHRRELLRRMFLKPAFHCRLTERRRRARRARRSTYMSPRGSDIRRNVTCVHVCTGHNSSPHIEQFRNLLTLYIAVVRGPIRRTALKWDSWDVTRCYALSRFEARSVSEQQSRERRGRGRGRRREKTKERWAR